MAQTHAPLRVSYDEEFDVLEILLSEPEPTLTIELQEDVYAHVVPKDRRIIGLTVHRFRKKHRENSLPFLAQFRPMPDVEDRLARALVPA